MSLPTADLALFAGLAMGGVLVARFFLPDDRWSARAFILLALAMMVPDPYTFGWTGGDENLRAPYPWQGALALVSALLLVIAALRTRRLPRATPWLLYAELCVFLAANTAFVVRDGMTMRALRGYEASPIPIIAVTVALAARCAAIAVLTVQGRSGPSEGVPS